MNKTITVNKKPVNVNFSGYYDSAIGELLFTQVMCDVFMPGNEVVPIPAEKEQIKRIVEGFKKRKALSDELRKETVKGKAYYVISPRMRYDLAWLEGRKKVKLTKDAPPQELPSDDIGFLEAEDQPPSESARKTFTDNRRVYLESKGFRFNETTNNWEAGSIRFPDAMIGKAQSDEEFTQDMERLMNADQKNNRKRGSNRT